MTQWIKVEDEKPPINIDVLVFVGMPESPSGMIDIGFFTEDNDWITKYKGSRVTHWMPMPEYPQS